jgi:hypothetical protein
LKSVLGRILDGLDGPRYREIRSQLKSAREQMDEIGAKQRIRAELLTSIERNHAEASKRKEHAQQTGDNLSEKDKLWLGHGDPRCLPSLLNDPATQKLFTIGTSFRPGIISELARHIAKDTSATESPRRQFERADFIVPDELANEIKEAGQIAGRYLDKLQRTTDTKSLDDAIKLLNSIVDDAIAPLATPTDTSLAELFYEVRRQLLADDRELILLVEDFAVLAGVQKALLDAIIREGESGGKREACTIRTALAVTDGYFGNLDTVKTRAIHGWWIETGANSDEDQIINHIGNFVAAYINAARIGAKRLEQHFADPNNVGKKAPNAMDFLAPEPEELELLANFGQSADGYSLFPFNPSAIATIADWRLRDNKGSLRFHPRSVINEIILPVVKDTRGSFERQSFPPANFLGSEKKVWPDLRKDVRRKEGDPEKQERYVYLLHFWANKPERLSEASVPIGLFRAFGLATLDGSQTDAVPKMLGPTSTPKDTATNNDATKKSEATESETEQVPIKIREFTETIDKWRSGGILGHGIANNIRQLINTHMMLSINWEAELLKPLNPSQNNQETIFLPNAKGNGLTAENAFVLVATDEQFKDPETSDQIFSIVRAMLRHDYYKNWSYFEADEDYIVIANFIDEHLAAAANWIHSRYKKVNGNPIPPLAQTLLWQARQLSVNSAHKADDASQIEAIFATPTKCVAPVDDRDWSVFLESLLQRREQLQDELFSRTGAFQGTGGKVYAIDATKILSAIQAFRTSWKVADTFPKLPNNPDANLKDIEAHVNMINRVGNAIVESRRNRIAEQSQLIVAELGKDYDKPELLKDLESVCTLSQQYGLSGEISVNQVRQLAERFREAPVKEVGKQVDAIVSGDDLPAQMTAIAKLDIETHALLVEFSQTCAQFLRKTLEEAVVPYQKVDA